MTNWKSKVSLGLLLCCGVCWADFSGLWKVEGDLSGLEEDVSAIVCSSQRGFPRLGLMLDDEMQSVTPIRLEQGRIQAQAPIPLNTDRWKDEPLELDGEGLAFGDGYYYVTGSYGAPRKGQVSDAKRAARIRACSRLYRLKLSEPDGVLVQKQEASVGLHDLIRQLPVLAPLRPFLEVSLPENGLTVEGLACLEGRLYFGLRAPAQPGECWLVSAKASALFEGSAANCQSTLHRIVLPKLGNSNLAVGVRDLTVYRDHLLVLLGPATGDGTEGFSVACYNPSTSKLKMLGQLPPDPRGRPEGLLVLDEPSEGTLRVLVLFDKLPQGSPRTHIVSGIADN